MLNTLINLRQRYKNYTDKQYNKYFYGMYNKYPYGVNVFKPNFKWNPFDIHNDWVYDNEKWREFLEGWMSIGCAWEAYTCWMRDMKYSYKLPLAMWAEINYGYMDMYVYSYKKK